MKKSKATEKQEKVCGSLLNQAVHALGELGIPCVLLMDGNDAMQVNCHPRLAQAMIEDAAQFYSTLRDKQIENRCDRIVGGFDTEAGTT